MDTWYVATFDDVNDSLRATSKLHDSFFALCAARKGPGTVAVFSCHDLRTNQVTWYFSPEASTLGQPFGAIPCEKPTPMYGLSLSVGEASSWETHFPGQPPVREP